jgi:hypothetical protein
MTTSEIYEVIKCSNNYTDAYIELTKRNYRKDIINLVFLLDFNVNVDDIEDDIIEKDEKEKRKYQKELRNKALERYSNRCVISGETKSKLIEVAHIKPVKDCSNMSEKKDIDNALLLWCDIHKYFDAYQISINPINCKVEINDTNEENAWMKKYKGMKLNCVNDNMKKYLEHHYNIFRRNYTK